MTTADTSLSMVLFRAFLAWLVIIAAETVHGVLRGLLLVPLVGDLPARQIGVPPSDRCSSSSSLTSASGGSPPGRRSSFSASGCCGWC